MNLRLSYATKLCLRMTKSSTKTWQNFSNVLASRFGNLNNSKRSCVTVSENIKPAFCSSTKTPNHLSWLCAAGSQSVASKVKNISHAVPHTIISFSLVERLSKSGGGPRDFQQAQDERGASVSGGLSFSLTSVTVGKN